MTSGAEATERRILHVMRNAHGGEIMAYNATIYNFMLGGPKDVDQHLAAVVEVAHEWNAIHSEHQKAVILPLHWATHARPRLGQRPQEIINEDVLARADVLIAIFSTRVGTPTGEDVSGTVEEIRKHIARSGRAIVYFSEIPVGPQSIELDQIAALREFRAECERIGVIRTFSSTDQLRSIAHRDISQLMNDLAIATAQTAATDEEETVQISPQAVELLRAAAKTRNGQIYYFITGQGDRIQAGEVTVNQGMDRKQFAFYKDAMRELLAEVLLEKNSDNVYTLTGRGFHLAEFLENQ